MSAQRKTATVMARVTPEDRAWVEREAERLGLDPSSFVRMTLRREKNEREGTMPSARAVA